MSEAPRLLIEVPRTTPHPKNRTSVLRLVGVPLEPPMALFDALTDLAQRAQAAGWRVNLAVELGPAGAGAMTFSAARVDEGAA